MYIQYNTTHATVLMIRVENCLDTAIFILKLNDFPIDKVQKICLTWQIYFDQSNVVFVRKMSDDWSLS